MSTTQPHPFYGQAPHVQEAGGYPLIEHALDAQEVAEHGLHPSHQWVAYKDEADCFSYQHADPFCRACSATSQVCIFDEHEKSTDEESISPCTHGR